jgi:hypothetical protein
MSPEQPSPVHGVLGNRVFAKATIAVAGYWPRALWDPAAAKCSVAIDNHCADRI